MKTNLKQVLTAALIFGGMLAGTASYAQHVPQKFNYQGVARDVKGNPMSKQTLGLKISVLAAEGATEAEYEEVQTVTTNEYGLYTLQIGAGTATKGEMKMVTWETGNKYIKVAIDPTGGNNYTQIGTTQLLSVPYAIYADRAGSAKNGGGSDRAGTVSTSAAGTGTVNFLTKFTAANTIYNSQVFDNGTNIGIGTTSPNAKVQITNTTTSPTELRINHTNTTGGASRLSFKNDSEAGFSATSDFAILNKYAIGTAGTAAPGYPFSRLFGFNNSRGSLLFSTNGSIGFGRYDISATPQVSVYMHIDSATNGNIGIGTVTPTAKLDVNGQVRIQGGAPGAGKVLTSDANGLATWQTPAASGSFWSLNGNAGTTSSNFLGTIDNVPLRFRINNQESGLMTLDELYFGYNSGKNATGANNTHLGALTGTATNYSGSQNTLIGNQAGEKLTTGHGNTFVGEDAGNQDSTGFNNVGLGEDAGNNIRRGNNNSLLGHNSDVAFDSLSYATAVGASASVSRNNSVVLGRTQDNVGIGNTNPGSKLSVSSAISVGNETVNAIESGRLNFTEQLNASSYGDTSYMGFGFHYNGSTNELKLQSAGSAGATKLDVMTFDRTSGKIAVGNVASTPGTYKLYVEDGILTERLKVAVNGSSSWADYVFADDYNLLPLEEVETFIAKNKHLPNVPSADEMAENGIDVATVDAKLMEKIEELTLYLIQMKKEIQSLKEENATIKANLKK